MLELQLKESLFKYLPKIFKNLVSVLTISVLVTKASKKVDIVLEKVSCIYNSVQF